MVTPEINEEPTFTDKCMIKLKFEYSQSNNISYLPGASVLGMKSIAGRKQGPRIGYLQSSLPKKRDISGQLSLLSLDGASRTLGPLWEGSSQQSENRTEFQHRNPWPRPLTYLPI